ncbi:MAG: thioredoxin-disulfide reductase [Spirochaetaceae bacterium]|nr:MAG: thioredoxin-disulfide reductase [Spirochaetaceae bacterium]
MQPDKDVIIIGAGAAGLAAAQYAARANLTTLVIEEMAAGGQALIIDNIENYPGFPDPISGFELSQRMERHAIKFGAEFSFGTVNGVEKKGNIFQVTTNAGSGTISSHAVILATGAKHRQLDVPGEKEFCGKGVSYCATCDGPLFKNKRMIVVGGGDAACDEAMYLANLASEVVIIHRRNRFRAQKSLAERVLKNPKINIRFSTECRAILGTDRVSSVKLFDNTEKREYEESTDAVFIFVGTIPQAQAVAEIGVKLDESGYVLTNDHMETNVRGLFVAGDVRTTQFRQIVVAAGEGAVAAHSCSQYIDELRGQAYS